MLSRPAFSRLDMLAAFAVGFVACCIALATPGCGGGGASTSNKMKAADHARKLGSAFIQYAQGNKDYYPGLDGAGQLTANGADPAARISHVLKAKLIKPEELINPIETDRTPATGESATTANFSFALLRIDGDTPRRHEWKGTMNSRAAVASDRNTGTGGGQFARSIAGGEKWTGVVLWNDNHCVWELSNVLKQTEFNFNRTPNDDLFADDKSEQSVNQQDMISGADAAMVYQDATSYSHSK